MAYPITDIRGIGADTAAILKSEGIRTTVGLLRSAKTPKQRLKIAEKVGIDDKHVLDWVTAADRMRVKGVGWEYSELLCAAGVKTVNELKYRNPQKLVDQMSDANTKRKLVQAVAVGDDGRALDRKRQEAAARHPLLIGCSARPALLDLPRPRASLPSAKAAHRALWNPIAPSVCSDSLRRQFAVIAAATSMATSLHPGAASATGATAGHTMLSGLLAKRRPLIMGVLNVTPDSFSDGGRFFDARAALAQARRLAAEGADIIDVGAESTRPYGGAVRVSLEDERARLAPVLSEVISLGVPVSIDTQKAPVAGWALDLGVAIINDVWGLQRDPDMGSYRRGAWRPRHHHAQSGACRSGHRHHRRCDCFLPALARHRRARRHSPRARLCSIPGSALARRLSNP